MENKFDKMERYESIVIDSKYIQKISNHPIFTDVERYIKITMQNTDIENKKFEFWFKCIYVLDGLDVTKALEQPSNKSIYTDNTKIHLLRDSEFNPIPNPDWDGISESEYDMYLTVSGWDLIDNLISTDVNITEMLKSYILVNDEEKYFDN